MASSASAGGRGAVKIAFDLRPDAGLAARSNRTLREEVYRIFDQTFAVTRLLQAMSLLIAACGVTLTLLILARERVSELALYRALVAIGVTSFVPRFGHLPMVLGEGTRKLLADDPQWPPDALRAAIDSGETRTVNLRRPVPVYLLYWTAWGGSDGAVQFRRDIYDRDAPLAAALAAPLQGE